MMLQELEIIPSMDSRMELLAWLNEKMPHTAPNGMNIPTVRRVESCGNFVPYLLMLPQMLPVPYAPLLSSTRMKVPARLEFEAATNLKLLNDALHRNGVVRPDVLVDHSEKMIRGNFQANFTFLQWFKGFHDALAAAGIEAGQGRVTGFSEAIVIPSSDSEDSATAVLGPGLRRSSAQRRMSISSQREDSRGGSMRRSTPSRLLMSNSEMPPRRMTPPSSASGPARRSTATGSTPQGSGRTSAARPLAGSSTLGASGVSSKARTTTPPTRAPASRTGSSRLGSTTGGTGFGGRMNSPHAGAKPSYGVGGGAASASRVTRPASGMDRRPRAASACVSTGTASAPRAASAAGAPTAAAEESMRQTKLERQFYFDKLRMIEKLVVDVAKRDLSGDDVAAVTLARSVRDVLYATN